MHEEFYLNKEHTTIEKLNERFNEGIKIKNYLKSNEVKCGYILECNANLIPAMFKKTGAVYLKSKDKKEHLKICPYNDLLIIRNKMVKKGSLHFLIKNFPTISSSSNKDSDYEINKLIVGEHKSNKFIKLAELFNLLKSDLKLAFLKETSFIDPNYCEQ